MSGLDIAGRVAYFVLGAVVVFTLFTFGIL